VSVTPRRAVAGRRTRFRVRVRDSRGRVVRGALVRLGGRRARTNRRGLAVLRVALPRAGRFSVTAARGRARGRVVVRAVAASASGRERDGAAGASGTGGGASGSAGRGGADPGPALPPAGAHGG
jgi:hypothetical protein